jgi:hypothetical protein
VGEMGSEEERLYEAEICVRAKIAAILVPGVNRPGTLMLEISYDPVGDGGTPVTDRYPMSAFGPFAVPEDSRRGAEIVQARAAAFGWGVKSALDHMLPMLINNITVLAASHAVPDEEGDRFFSNRATFQLKIINALVRNIKTMLDLPDLSKPGPRRKTISPGQIVAAIRKVARAGQPVTQENVAKQLEISVSTLERIIRNSGVTFTAIKNGLF